MDNEKRQNYVRAIADVWLVHIRGGGSVESVLAGNVHTGGISRSQWYRFKRGTPDTPRAVYDEGIALAEEEHHDDIVDHVAHRRAANRDLEDKLAKHISNSIERIVEIIHAEKGVSAHTRVQAFKSLLDAYDRATHHSVPRDKKEDGKDALLPLPPLEQSFMPLPIPVDIPSEITVRSPSGEVISITRHQDCDIVDA